MEWYILLDQMYFLVNQWSYHVRVLYWVNTIKYTVSRASQIRISQYWESSTGCIFYSIDPVEDSGAAAPRIHQWMRCWSLPPEFLSTRVHQIWQRIPLSAMCYKGILHIENFEGITFVGHLAGKNTLSVICLSHLQSSTGKNCCHDSFG